MEGLRYEDFLDSGAISRAYATEEEAIEEGLRCLDFLLAAACKGREAEREGLSGPRPGGQEQEEFLKLTAHIQARLERTRREKGSLRLEYLKRVFNWGPLMELAFFLALGPEYMRKYGRLYQSLGTEEKQGAPDLELALELFLLFQEPQPEEKRRLFQAEDGFWLCFQRDKAEGLPFIRKPLILKERIVRFLRGNGPEGTRLGEISEWLSGTEEPVYIYQQQEEELWRAAEAMRAAADGGCRAIVLSARKGSGKHFLARRLARHMRKGLCMVHVPRLLEMEGGGEELLREIRLESRLSLSLIGFDGLDCLYAQEELTPRGRWFLDGIARLPGLFLFLEEEGGGVKGLACGWKLNIPLEPPGPAKKIRLWQACAEGFQLGPDVDLSLCGSQYVLNTGEIRRVLRTASLLARSQGREVLGREDITGAVKQHSSRMLGSYASLVRCVFTWEDLVVEEEARRQMEHICNQLKYRSVVADEWDFYRKTPYGRGLCALFYGPPGTGKTMAVQVIANELGLDLYRIDLSQMVSKYIGETEKNISQLFERAKDINALLFFDEADAFFARRSEVGDANDRNANAETAHLLQKLEEYEGITILATNLKDNIDDAFRRRIRFMINFKLPDAQTRKRLWARMFPPQAPLEEDVDLDFFAERFELSGSAIKEIAINAAYMAAAGHGAIGNRHLVEALRLNYEKLGKRLTREELSYLA